MDDPLELKASFLTHYSNVYDESTTASDSLEAALQQLLSAGRNTWPGFSLCPLVFVKYLASRVSGPTSVLKTLSELHGSDLYLACACAHRLPQALSAFDKNYLSFVKVWIARIDTSPAFADDVCQSLREKLFIPQRSGFGKISEYSGRGQLLSWLRVAAMRTAIDISRMNGPQRRAKGDKIVDHIVISGSSPETNYIKLRYQDIFKEAVHLALSCLSDEEHNLIRLYYEHGLSMEQIGVLFGVNRSTIKRRLDENYERLRKEIKCYLHQRLQVSSDQLRSLVALLISRFELGTSSQ